MVESIGELRKKVQEPVRRYNDISGMLLGDHASIYITRLFIRMGWSPTLATLGMLISGLSGSVLLLCGDRLAVLGFFLLVMHYVFDCVDGEVARYHKSEKVVWSVHDYLFHFYIKSAFFFCFGLAAYRTTGSFWMFGIAWLGLSSSVLSKMIRELPALLASRLVLQRDPDPDDRSYRQLTEGVTEEDLAEKPCADGTAAPASYGSFLSKVRSIVTNFDLMLVALFFIAIVDLFVAPFTIFGVLVNLKTVAFCGLVANFTLDFIDRLITSLRGHRIQRDAGAMLVRAHHFRIRR